MAKTEIKRTRGRRVVAGNGHREGLGAKGGDAAAESGITDLPPLEPEMFINRELSWLDFNDRVLFEAEEATNPLLERVKFAAIFSSNLDEFFMIRVAGIKRKIAAGIATLVPTDRTPISRLPGRAGEDAGLTGPSGRDHYPRLAAGSRRRRDRDRSLTRSLSDSNERRAHSAFRGGDFPHPHPASDRPRPTFPPRLEPQPQSDRGAEIPRVRVTPESRSRDATPLRSRAGRCRNADHGRAACFTWLEDVVAANLPRLFVGAEVVASIRFTSPVIQISSFDEDDATPTKST